MGMLDSRDFRLRKILFSLRIGHTAGPESSNKDLRVDYEFSAENVRDSLERAIVTHIGFDRLGAA